MIIYYQMLMKFWPYGLGELTSFSHLKKSLYNTLRIQNPSFVRPLGLGDVIYCDPHLRCLMRNKRGVPTL